MAHFDSIDKSIKLIADDELISKPGKIVTILATHIMHYLSPTPHSRLYLHFFSYYLYIFPQGWG